MSDALVLGLFGLIATLVSTFGAITVALLTRGYRQGKEIHHMVNGELSRTRKQVEVLTKKLQVLTELGVVSSFASDELIAEEDAL